MDKATIMEWLKVILPLIGGGAVGALITLLVTNHRNKIQKISYRVKLEKIFFPEALSHSEITKITFSSNTQTYHFNNLFIATIQLTNSGNKDIEKFILGITLPEEIKIVKVDSVLPDRNHMLNVTSGNSFDKLLSEIDVELFPFNRKDNYEIKLYLTISKETIDTSDISLSSPHPIRFVPNTDSAQIWNSARKIMEASIGHY